MADRKRTLMRTGQSVTPHRLKKRYATRITATPCTAAVLARMSSKKDTEEEIESVREANDYYSLPLPTSPAPSPPRPQELCPRSNCSLTGSPNETLRFTYRKIFNEKDETMRDAFGRQTAGRHRIPAREFSIDRSYMTPSSKAKNAHGISYWPDPPMKSFEERGQSVDTYHQTIDNAFVFPTSARNESKGRRMDSMSRKPVARRQLRLIIDENDEGMEADNEEEDEEKRRDARFIAATHSRGDTRRSSSSRKRRASMAVPLKVRRRLYAPGEDDVHSDGVRLMTSSEKGTTEGGGDDGVNDGNVSLAFSGDVVIVDDENSVVDGDLDRTLEEEKDEMEEADGYRKRAEDGEKDDDNEMRVDGRVEEEDEEEVEEEEKDEGEKEEEKEEKEDAEEGEEMGHIEIEDESFTDGIVVEGEEETGLTDSEDTLQAEINESEGDDEGEVDSNGQNRSLIGDVSMIDNTLPLDDVIDSIDDEHLRRLLAACKQTDVIDMEEFMSGITSGVKVGEGGYAEVFLVKRTWNVEERVFKILKIGEEVDAGKFFGEVIISKELTRLRMGRISTCSFAKLHRASVIRGLFPRLLSNAWDRFRETNDDAINEYNPTEFGENQMFLCLECEYGGLNLKKFPFSSVLELISVYCQTALALAVAETEFRFEHRDLHEENVLVKRTDEKAIEFTYDRPKENGDESGTHKWTRVPSHGVKTTIIDFTLSRMTRKPESRHFIPDVDICHELGDDICEQDEEAEQYQVYKKMKKLTKCNWSVFAPKTNVLWLNMQINWIIQENLNPKSELNKKRLEASRTAKSSRKSVNPKKIPRRHSKRRSMELHSDGDEEKTELSGEGWIKKIKEGSSLIKQLKSFAKKIKDFDSADQLVNSDGFETLLDLLKE